MKDLISSLMVPALMFKKFATLEETLVEVVVTRMRMFGDSLASFNKEPSISSISELSFKASTRMTIRAFSEECRMMASSRAESSTGSLCV